MNKIRWTNAEETLKNQIKDSDMIFTQITTSQIDTMADATRLIVRMYVPDMSISRAGISHALKRLEKHYHQPQKLPSTDR